MSPNELLLLDEPTNHLDLDAVLWLESWLKQREGTLILISHDREFLDSVTNMTLHIEAQTADLVTGNYSAFEKWKAARQGNQQAAHEKAQARRKELQSFVDRFRAKATKARQAQSRLKMLERMGETQAVRIETPFRFGFKTPEAMPSPLVVLQDCDLGYGDTRVIKQVKMSVQSGDRIGLLGVNGAGKSTLVKALVGDLAPLTGSRTPAQRLKIGYFAQHQVDQLRGDHSPLQAMLSFDPSLSEGEARTFLGHSDFKVIRPCKRLRRSQVEKEHDWRWRSLFILARIYCCWMNLPTIWISSCDKRWQMRLSPLKVRCWLSHMTGRCCVL